MTLPSARIDELLAAAERFKAEKWALVDDDESATLLVVRAPNDTPVAESTDHGRSSFIALANPATITALIAEVKAARAANRKPFDLDRFLQDDSNLPPFASPPVKAQAEREGEPVAWQCEQCGCKTHARCDEKKPDGSFGPGPHVRCVNCKAVTTYPPASPLPVEPVTVGGSASEEQVEAVARYICAATLHTSWDGLQEGRITERGYKPFAYNNFGGWRFQGGHEDIRDIARKVIAALSATTAREAGWQPIETAPKDGSNVLLYADGVREYARYVVGHWGKALLTPAQWFDYAGTKPLGLTPTHWRPLPTPPFALHHGGGSQ